MANGKNESSQHSDMLKNMAGIKVMDLKVSVVGLGKLGASFLAAAASRGFEVIGYDIDPAPVSAIADGKAPVWETDLERTICENQRRIEVTSDLEHAIRRSNYTLVVVPTPSEANGAFSLEIVKAAFAGIGRALRDKNGYHLVALGSTVLPNSMRSVLVPELEMASGKTCGLEFGVCYTPLFIALGSIIHDILHPDFVLVGESDETAGDTATRMYSQLLTKQAPCRRMNFENAEVVKLAVNTYITTKITFANMLAVICDLLPGCDVDVVTTAIGEDTRIGGQYLKGGLGFGGPCFPRDNKALIYLMQSIGVNLELPSAVDAINRRLPKIISRALAKRIKPHDKVAILGLSYKPKSHWAEEAQGVYLANELASIGANVVGYDPLANDMARELLSPDVRVVESINDCVQNAQYVLVTTPDESFKAILPQLMNTSNIHVCVIDFWRMFDELLCDAPNIEYIPFGRGKALLGE